MVKLYKRKTQLRVFFITVWWITSQKAAGPHLRVSATYSFSNEQSFLTLFCKDAIALLACASALAPFNIEQWLSRTISRAAAELKWRQTELEQRGCSRLMSCGGRRASGSVCVWALVHFICLSAFFPFLKKERELKYLFLQLWADTRLGWFISHVWRFNHSWQQMA